MSVKFKSEAEITVLCDRSRENGTIAHAPVDLCVLEEILNTHGFSLPISEKKKDSIIVELNGSVDCTFVEEVQSTVI